MILPLVIMAASSLGGVYLIQENDPDWYLVLAHMLFLLGALMLYLSLRRNDDA